MSGIESPSAAARLVPARRRQPLACLFIAACALAVPTGGALASGPAPAAVERHIETAIPADREVAAFYRARAFRPLWIEGGRLRPEAERAAELVAGAEADGLDPAAYGARELGAALRRARGGAPADLAPAELLLSAALAAYARDLRRPAEAPIVYVDRELAPRGATVRSVLDGLAAAPSLSAGIDAAVRQNPLYAGLRAAYAAARARGPLPAGQESSIRASLERLRALPVELGRRFILVDAASAQLWMYEDGRVRDGMKVVIGRPGEQTPLMAAYVRHLALNPYWNVPPDLVHRLIAPAVLREGQAYLRGAGYEVLSDWSEGARAVQPGSVNWADVAAGRTELPVRQLPGPRNAMGEVKFMFPNALGVYLHDTPNRELFAQADRRRSAGCVRVEDAGRLARWLLGTTPPASNVPEQIVPLPDRVPVYITYLTAMPRDGRIAFSADHYGRDPLLLARLGGRGFASAR
jgi:murein L,D-transpeptidase YcbB/YkuD